MSVSFSSGVTVGQTGNLGREYDIQYRRYQKNQSVFGEASFYGNLVTMGLNEEKVLNKFENDMGYSNGSLSWGRSVASNEDKNNILFKDNTGNFVDVNFDNNCYRVQSERNVAESFGLDWSNGKPYDIMTVDQGGISFYEFTSTGLGDGVQNGYGFQRQNINNIKWGLTSFYHQEVDYRYLLADYNTDEGLKGQWIRQVLLQNANQYMNNDEIATLSSMTDTNARLGLAQVAYTRLFV